MGDHWIQLYGGKDRKFDFDDIDVSGVTIESIAVSLSRIPRFLGHTPQFVSVAEHSMWVASLVPDRLKMTGLLHDAAESLICDIPRPLKRKLGVYPIEHDILLKLAEKFGFFGPGTDEWSAVMEADNMVLRAEAMDFMGSPEWALSLPMAPEYVKPGRGILGVGPQLPDQAMYTFMALYASFLSYQEA